MNIILKDKNIIKLCTKNKYVKEDIKVSLDDSLIPSGTLNITENGEYDVTNKASVNVNVASSGGEDMLQARVDATNSCEYLMYEYDGTNVSFLSKLNTSKVTNMDSMFSYCKNITSCPDFDTSNVTNMRSMFINCKNLASAPLFDTSNATNMSSMFVYCMKLTTIPAFNVSNVTNLNGTFDYCNNLKSILMYGMKVKFNISASTKFEREDLVTILNNLGTVTTATTLTMGSTNLAKLTDTDKEIATNKGWTLA